MTLASNLKDVTLPGGWNVLEIATPGASVQAASPPSVGQFSKTYIVEKNGVRAFLKAIDMAGLMGSSGLETMTAELNQWQFERTVLEMCRDRKLDGIVRIVDAGEYRPLNGGPLDRVPYLIFELASGDARKFIPCNDGKAVADALRLTHRVATGLRQLHEMGVSHQDIKLSNIFTFGNGTQKLGDVGRAIPRLNSLIAICPHIDCALAGDPTYAPPELIYNEPPDGWEKHRLGADIYLLGSVVVAMFMGAGMTSLVQNALADEHKAHGWVSGQGWGGRFEEVLPYLRNATDEVLRDFGAQLNGMNSRIMERLVPLIREMCDPDPVRRGDLQSVKEGRGHDLQRIISRLDLAASEAAIRR